MSAYYTLQHWQIYSLENMNFFTIGMVNMQSTSLQRAPVTHPVDLLDVQFTLISTKVPDGSLNEKPLIQHKKRRQNCLGRIKPIKRQEGGEGVKTSIVPGRKKNAKACHVSAPELPEQWETPSHNL